MSNVSRAGRLYHFMGLFALVAAGEAVFSLPFHIVRFFRPTVLDVFQLSNTQIGQVQATYGVIAMISYFFGGPLADRYEAKNLMVLALLSTALGGFYFSQIPDQRGLYYLYGFWGCSSILLFWGALIKATREWGGAYQQGRAFGFLEAGRGAFAAILVSAAIAILSFSVPNELDQLGDAERRTALQQITYLYIAATIIAAILVALFIPYSRINAATNVPTFQVWRNIGSVIKNPLIWPQMLIVLSAYVAYKGVDNYVLYAVQGYGLDEIEGAKVGALSSWVRPIAAILAGILADRYRASRVISICFLMLLAGYSVFMLLTPEPSLYWVLSSNVVVTSFAVYALHAIYFALLEESKVPLNVTGTAIGAISVIGFTPDVFVGPGMGWMLDNHTAITGHQMVFAALAMFAAIGVLSSITFIRQLRVYALNRE